METALIILGVVVGLPVLAIVGAVIVLAVGARQADRKAREEFHGQE